MPERAWALQPASQRGKITFRGKRHWAGLRAQRSDEGDPEDPGMNVRGCAHRLLTPCDVSDQSAKPPRGWPLAGPAFEARSEADTCSASGAHQQRSGLMSLWWSTGVPNLQTFVARAPKYLLKNFLTSVTLATTILKGSVQVSGASSMCSTTDTSTKVGTSKSVDVRSHGRCHDRHGER